MPTSRSMQTGPQLPRIDRWLRNLLVGLLALFVVELIARNLGLPVDLLALWSHGGGFAPWQPVTRYAIQGAGGGAVWGVLIGLMVIGFSVTPVAEVRGRRRLGGMLATAMVGGTVVGVLFAWVGIAPGPLFGWISLVEALIVAFGLVRPDAQVLLMFVLPVSGRALVWGSLGLSLLMLLATRSPAAADSIGVWVGTMAWWQLVGPGARRRQLKAKAVSIERELKRFDVLEGGRSRPQGRQDDDLVH